MQSIIQSLEKARDIFNSNTYTFASVIKGSELNKVKSTTEFDESLYYRCTINLKTRRIEIDEKCRSR